MIKLFNRTKDLEAEFCERCGSVSDAASRSDAIRDAARTSALAQGLRVL